MGKLREFLELTSCPHCSKPHPSLQWPHQSKDRDCFQTSSHDEVKKRWWGIYVCRSCGGVIAASAPVNPSNDNLLYAGDITAFYPVTQTIDESIPQKPRVFLLQAQESLHAPAGAIMLSASAVDAMLKEKNYTEGSLYERIDNAKDEHLITEDMAKWAHKVRLDANEQRHADRDVGLPTQDDAKLTFDFAMAFAEYLFVLPSKVTRGIVNTQPPRAKT